MCRKNNKIQYDFYGLLYSFVSSPAVSKVGLLGRNLGRDDWKGQTDVYTFSNQNRLSIPIHLHSIHFNTCPEFRALIRTGDTGYVLHTNYTQ